MMSLTGVPKAAEVKQSVSYLQEAALMRSPTPLLAQPSRDFVGFPTTPA